MPKCPKKSVRATIFSLSGKVYIGTNDITNDIPLCPRLPGEGYSKCHTICGQHEHAETNAIAAAGDDAKGGTLVLEGHDHLCDACMAAAKAAGIELITITEGSAHADAGGNTQT